MAFHRWWAGCALVMVIVACDFSEARPEAAPPSSRGVASQAAAETSSSRAPHTRLSGRWLSEQLCLELFANGDFEISVLGRGPKVLVMGSATAAATEGPDVYAVELAVSRIWNARWVGRCRRTHLTGRWADAQDVLGTTLTPGQVASFELTRRGDDRIELCHTECVTLERAPPILGGRWRHEGLESPTRPTVAWRAGHLLEMSIHLDGMPSHLWTGRDEAAFQRVYGRMELAAGEPDRFAVTFTPTSYEDVREGETPSVLGSPLAMDAPTTLAVRRMPEQTIEVCGPAGRCVTLERQFDSNRYDLY